MRDDYVRELDIRAQVTMTSDGAQVYQLFIVTCSLSPITKSKMYIPNCISQVDHFWFGLG
jgi:hypothetical protein